MNIPQTNPKSWHSFNQSEFRPKTNFTLQVCEAERFMSDPTPDAMEPKSEAITGQYKCRAGVNSSGFSYPEFYIK